MSRCECVEKSGEVVMGVLGREKEDKPPCKMGKAWEGRRSMAGKESIHEREGSVWWCFCQQGEK